MSLAESLKKKIRLCNGGNYGREIVLNFFLKDYGKNLQKMANRI